MPKHLSPSAISLIKEHALVQGCWPQIWTLWLHVLFQFGIRQDKTGHWFWIKTVEGKIYSVNLLFRQYVENCCKHKSIWVFWGLQTESRTNSRLKNVPNHYSSTFQPFLGLCIFIWKTPIIFLLLLALIRKATIFNIIRWVAGSMGWSAHWPSIWCSKYYFFFL